MEFQPKTSAETKQKKGGGGIQRSGFTASFLNPNASSATGGNFVDK